MKIRSLYFLLILLFLLHFPAAFAEGQTGGAGSIENNDQDNSTPSPFSQFLSSIQSLLTPAKEEPESSAQSSSVIPLSDYHVGDIITLGHYEQDGNRANGREVIEWRILKLEGDRALVISQYGLANRPYILNGQNRNDTWEDSVLREWLNGAFFSDAFSAEEQQLIPTVMVNTKNPPKSTRRSKSTQDRIFLLSETEAKDYFSSDADRKLSPTAYVEDVYGSYLSSWFLRSSGEESWGYILFTGVDSDGEISKGFYGFHGALVRPAFWLSLSGYSGPAEDDSVVDAVKPDDRTGKYILFGSYEQDNNKGNGPEPIIWQVLTVENGMALVISKYSLDFMTFSENMFNEYTWETSSVREWLNNRFYRHAFDIHNENGRIGLYTNENPDNPDYGTDCGNPTKDYVFLLSLDEVLKYMPTANDRLSGATKYADSVSVSFYSYIFNPGVTHWMLRTLGERLVISKVNNKTGNILMTAGNGGDLPTGIRPAMWLNIDGLELYDELPNLEKQVLDDSVMVDTCPMRSYLKPGDHAEVAINAGLKIRKKPAGAETGIQAFSGKDVKILDGPVCENGAVWFEIDFLGHRGWSMEGKDGTYYLQKTSGAAASAAVPDNSAASQQSGSGSQNSGGPAYPTLRPGDTVDIINIASLRMFTTPNRNPMEGIVAFPGKTAKITDGPKLENSVYWYEIDFLGYRGWVMGMTTGGTYYLEKVN